MIKTVEELKQKIDIIKKEKKELEKNIKDIEINKNTMNNELAHAVRIFKIKYPEKLKIFKKIKNSEFKEEDYIFFDKDGIHKNTRYI